MRPSPAPSRVLRARRLLATATAGAALSALLLPSVAGAQDSTVVPIVLPVVTTTVAPPTTVAPTTTVAPVTAPPTTAAPATTAAPTTAPPTTVAVAVTAPATLLPTRVAPTTKKPKAALSTGNPAARGATSVEVSIAKQRMYIYKGGTLYRTVKVSTGNGKRYCEKGKCGVAITPRGRFRVYNRINGWRTSYLGRLYNPLYFRGGYAIHGSGSVPNYPASHGCVRVSMTDARWLPGAIPNGTSVWVH